jgi:hypothetical protein
MTISHISAAAMTSAADLAEIFGAWSTVTARHRERPAVALALCAPVMAPPASDPTHVCASKVTRRPAYTPATTALINLCSIGESEALGNGDEAVSGSVGTRCRLR